MPFVASETSAGQRHRVPSGSAAFLKLFGPQLVAEHIGSSEALRTGAYGNTLAFTLSTTAP